MFSTSKLLEPFETDMINLINKKKLRKRSNQFQQKLRLDIKSIKNFLKMWFNADNSQD